MKKLLFTFMAFTFIVTAVQAQSLLENPHYRESVRLQEAATTAYVEGDYDAAAEYARLAQESAELSDEFVAETLSMQAASIAVANARARYDWAASVRAETRFAEDYTMATEEMNAADAAFSARQFDNAIAHAYMVESYLSGVTDASIFPAQYVVEELSLNTDCFWRIAAKPFVYNDPLKWPSLYAANKSLLPNPGNPDLLPPGLLLTIPSLSGELREGVWTKGVEYPTFGDK